MKILAKQNRELIMINAQNTQNENDAEKITLQVPEQYEDFNKKIVFVTPAGNVWDIITNNEYLIKKAITKYKQVDFYIWLTKGDVDFRSQTKTLKFYHNVDASDEITNEEIGRVNTVINLLEEEITKVNNLETEIDGKLEEIDTAIQETENLNLDAEKVNNTTTVTLTKKDGTVKTVHIDDGVDLQFMWQGTSLGIKTEDQQEYTFVDLQGVQGPAGPQGEPFTIKKTYSSVAEMNADFNNMQLGDYVMIASTVEVEDNAKLYTRGKGQWIFITDFSGATGVRGETGLTPNIQIGAVTQGSSFNVTRTGTNENPVLNFTLVKGDKGDRGIQGIQGLTGNGISSITKTGTSGLVDTYTITYTNGNTTTFTITNGEDGEVTETELDVLRQKVANQQKVIDQLPQVTGQGTSITLENTIEAQFTKFEIEGNSTQDGTPSPDNEVPILSAGDNGSINEKIKNADGTEEQDYSIPVQQPMRSIGDVRDLFFKNTKDSKYYDKDLEKNKWYERHPIFRKIFTGNETFTLQSINDYGIANFNYKTGNTAYQVNGNILCNRFITQTAGISSIKTDGIYMNWGNEIYIRILASEIDTVEKLKTWLATLYTNGNPVYIDYILKTPLDLPCTEEQIQQLENKPSTYKEMTIINSEDETPAYLEVAGIYDLNNLINN